MSFTAKDVQALREKTGVGMMDCKKALTESDGDMDKAIDFLREKGLAAASKKAGRIAAEGVVASYYDEKVRKAAIVEVNSETDFVAKNEVFKTFAGEIAKTIVDTMPADVDDLLNKKLSGSDRTVLENLQDKILSIGENIKIRRFTVYDGIVSMYIHTGGTVGVLVGFETDAAAAASDDFKAMGKDIAMQVSAMNPLYLDRNSVPADVIEHEKTILMTQIQEDEKMRSKPEKVLEGIVAGKLGKYFKEFCLLEQQFIKDNELNVEQYIANTAKKLGAEIKVTRFIRYEKGEGLQKRENDLAAEVAGMVH